MCSRTYDTPQLQLQMVALNIAPPRSHCIMACPRQNCLASEPPLTPCLLRLEHQQASTYVHNAHCACDCTLRPLSCLVPALISVGSRCDFEFVRDLDSILDELT